MSESRRHRAFVAAASLALSACDGASLRPTPAVCSGVPGDPTTPVSAAVSAPTHGPGVAAPAPVEMRAVQSWQRRKLQLHGFLVPMLYVYDDTGGFALGVMPRNDTLSDGTLRDAAKFGFWTEVADGQYYELPSVSSCEQLTLLGDDFNFRAPSGGYLFVQYRMHDCATCDRVSAAIQRTLDDHPQLPARWVQFDLASTTNDWCYRGYGFWPRDRDTENDKDYTCLK